MVLTRIPSRIAAAMSVGAVSLLAACLLAVTASGCQTAHVAHPLPPALYANDTDMQLEFWHTMAGRKLTSNDEAFHGVLLYVDGADKCDGYDARVKNLKDRGMLPADFKGAANDAVLRGNLAVALVKALHIKGGVAMHIVGPTPRYALRELEFDGLYPPSSVNQTFSGAEFVGIIGKADDFQSTQPKGNELPLPRGQTAIPTSHPVNSSPATAKPDDRM